MRHKMTYLLSIRGGAYSILLSHLIYLNENIELLTLIILVARVHFDDYILFMQYCCTVCMHLFICFKLS